MMERSNTAEAGSLDTAALAIRGMTCSGCAGRVQRALAQEPGVRGAVVDLAGGQAEVHYDPAETTPGMLAEVVRLTGYSAELIHPEATR